MDPSPLAGKDPALRVWEHDPPNAETPAALLGRTDPTPVSAFYVRSHGGVPRLDAATHAVQVDGLVDEPRRWTVGELGDLLPVRTVCATLQCAGHRRAGLMA